MSNDPLQELRESMNRTTFFDFAVAVWAQSSTGTFSSNRRFQQHFFWRLSLDPVFEPFKELFEEFRFSSDPDHFSKALDQHVDLLGMGVVWWKSFEDPPIWRFEEAARLKIIEEIQIRFTPVQIGLLKEAARRWQAEEHALHQRSTRANDLRKSV